MGPFLLYLLPQLSAGPATLPPTPTPIITTSEPYDCQSQGLWSFDKKGWCCEHYNVGCPTTPPPTPAPPPPPQAPPPPPQSTTSPCPFDCNAGYQDLGHSNGSGVGLAPKNCIAAGLFTGDAPMSC